MWGLFAWFFSYFFQCLPQAELTSSINSLLNWAAVGMKVSRLLGLSNSPIYQHYLI